MAYRTIPKYQGLSVYVSYTDNEIAELENQYKKAWNSVNYSQQDDVLYYTMKPYLRHLYGYALDYKQYMSIEHRVRQLKYEVRTLLKAPMGYDKSFVKEILKNEKKDKPISIHRKPLGLVVKLFPYTYYGKKSILKTYIFKQYNVDVDPGQDELYQDMTTTNFVDEIVFQKYGKQLGIKHSFIVPEIYAYGRMKDYIDLDDGSVNKTCCYIIMEHIDGIMLKDAVFSRETLDRVYEIDLRMKEEMLDHNDLHFENIMLVNDYEKTNSAKIAILDFGEAAHATRKRIF
jgi:hypothetical protein